MEHSFVEHSVEQPAGENTRRRVRKKNGVIGNNNAVPPPPLKEVQTKKKKSSTRPRSARQRFRGAEERRYGGLFDNLNLEKGLTLEQQPVHRALEQLRRLSEEQRVMKSSVYWAEHGSFVMKS